MSHSNLFESFERRILYSAAAGDAALPGLDLAAQSTVVQADARAGTIVSYSRDQANHPVIRVVRADGIVPTGTVTVPRFDGSSVTAALDAEGKAIIDEPRCYPELASYSGDAASAPSSVARFTMVNRAYAPSGFIVLTSASEVAAGDEFRVLVTMWGAGISPPTGTLTLKDGETVIATAYLGPDRLAVIETTALTPGHHDLTLSYQCDRTYSGMTQNGSPLYAPRSTQVSVDITATVSKRLLGRGKVSRAEDGSIVIDFSHFGVRPTGTLLFMDGPYAVDSAVFAEVPLVDGVAVLRAVPDHYPVYIAYGYSGDENHFEDRTRIDVVPSPFISSRPITIDIEPQDGALIAGQPWWYTISLNDPQLQDGEWFAGVVTIEVDGQQVARVDVRGQPSAMVKLTLSAGSHDIRATFDRGAQARVVDPFHASGATAVKRVTVAAGDPAGGGSHSPQSALPLPGHLVGDVWQVIAHADFDGDGDKDVLFRHTRNGHAYIWLMQSGHVASQSPLGVAPGWRAVGAADLDGDDKADVLWTNDAQRKQAIWKMNGIQLRGCSMLARARNAGWVLESAQDADGDGDADLLWRNANTGARYAWLMQGTQVVGGMELSGIIFF
jgi:hypothetical protein